MSRRCSTYCLSVVNISLTHLALTSVEVSFLGRSWRVARRVMVILRLPFLTWLWGWVGCCWDLEGNSPILSPVNTSSQPFTGDFTSPFSTGGQVGSLGEVSQPSTDSLCCCCCFCSSTGSMSWPFSKIWLLLSSSDASSEELSSLSCPIRN